MISVCRNLTEKGKAYPGQLAATDRRLCNLTSLSIVEISRPRSINFRSLNKQVFDQERSTKQESTRYKATFCLSAFRGVEVELYQWGCVHVLSAFAINHQVSRTEEISLLVGFHEPSHRHSFDRYDY
jgi:hypothetical protein